MNVTIIQTSIHWEDIDRNLALFSQKISALKVTTDLIVLPEMFSTGFSLRPEKLAEKMEGKTCRWMRAVAREKGCPITGSIIIEENGKYFNRLIWMDPEGRYRTYDKRHLFRYGQEQNHYSPGSEKIIVELKGWKICPLICYDLRFPVWSRNTGQGSPAYDILLYVANWPERRNHAWKILLSARAIENQCYVVGVNRIGSDGNDISYSGDSVVVNPRGEIVSKINAHEEVSETISLSYEQLSEARKNFPVGVDADEFTL